MQDNMTPRWIDDMLRRARQADSEVVETGEERAVRIYREGLRLADRLEGWFDGYNDGYEVAVREMQDKLKEMSEDE